MKEIKNILRGWEKESDARGSHNEGEKFKPYLYFTWVFYPQDPTKINPSSYLTLF